MGDLIEGRNPVLEALRSGRRVERVLIARGARPNPALDEILRRAAESGVTVESVDRSRLDGISVRGAHQGVAAYAEAFGYSTLGDVVDRGLQRERSLVVGIDHVEDPGNLGAILRSAEVAGADGVIVPRQRNAPMNAAALKAAAGAAEHLPVAAVPNLVRALEDLKVAGYWVVGASQHAEEVVWDTGLPGRLVLVLGSEGKGLSRLAEKTCDMLVRLPVAGHVSSLNVAQAASILMYEWVRQGHRREP